MRFTYSFTLLVTLALVLVAQEAQASNVRLVKRHFGSAHANGILRKRQWGTEKSHDLVTPKVGDGKTQGGGHEDAKTVDPKGKGVDAKTNGVRVAGKTAAGTATTFSDFKLAVAPQCSSDLAGSGVSLTGVKTILSFGDSYTDCGTHDGKACGVTDCPTAFPASGDKKVYSCGGRASNGPTWVENLAKLMNAKLSNYAIGGAVVDTKLTPRGDNDMHKQLQTYKLSGVKMEPSSTLCTAFFGINDRATAKGNNAALQKAAAEEISLLTSLKDSCGQFVFIDIDDPKGIFGQTLRSGVEKLGQSGIKAEYISVKSLFNGFDTQPASFGFKGSKPCLTGQNGGFDSFKLECPAGEAAQSSYFMSGHPSAGAHQLMAEFIQKGLTQCTGGNTGGGTGSDVKTVATPLVVGNGPATKPRGANKSNDQ